MGDLARATELCSHAEPRASTLSGGAARFTAELSREWEIWGPNGGYLCAIALRAAGRVARIPHLVSMHAHYLRVARFAPVELDVQVLAAGARAESIQVQMTQNEKPVLILLARTAAPGAGLAHDVAQAPNVVSHASLMSAEELQRPEHKRAPFWDQFDRRVLQPSAWALPRREAPPRWLEWLRYRARRADEEPFLSAARLALLIDTMCWPAAWLAHSEHDLIAPSLDLTVWFHRPFAGEWLLVEAEAPLAEAGLIAGRCTIWSESRALLASGGSQLLCVPSL